MIFDMSLKYPWLANRSPNNLFKDKIILKNYFIWLFDKYKANTNDKKYKIGYNEIRNNYGSIIVDSGQQLL